MIDGMETNLANASTPLVSLERNALCNRKNTTKQANGVFRAAMPERHRARPSLLPPLGNGGWWGGRYSASGTGWRSGRQHLPPQRHNNTFETPTPFVEFAFLMLVVNHDIYTAIVPHVRHLSPFLRVFCFFNCAAYCLPQNTIYDYPDIWVCLYDSYGCDAIEREEGCANSSMLMEGKTPTAVFYPNTSLPRDDRRHDIFGSSMKTDVSAHP